MTGTDTKARDVAPVKPSSRDPIAQWLDVFTSLLALPPSESERIRDELEDHLRTRVDDLLILGMSEPEAVQKAVTELGETAQLARNFKAVRIHSRRRIAMHTALFAAAGLALTVSVAGFLPKANTAPATSAPAIVDAQPEETAIKTLGVDLPGGTLEAILNTIAEATNARLFVHWNTLESYSGLTRDSEIGPIPAKDLDGSKILELMNSMLNLTNEGMLAVRHEGNMVEVANVAYFDRIETVTVDYDVSKLVPSDHVLMVTSEGHNLTSNIEMIVEPRVWQNNGGEATMTMSGSLLTVRAPKRIHVMVQRHIAKLEAIERQRAEQEVKDKELAQKQGNEMQEQSLASTEATLARQEAQLAAAMAEFEEVNFQYWRSDYSRHELETALQVAEGDESRAQALDALAKLGSQRDSLDMRRDILRSSIAETRNGIKNTREQLRYLRSIIEAQESASR